MESYVAEFSQQKFTALLRDPIESEGRVRIAGGVSRWDTQPPYASTMVVADGELQLYYPEQSTLEIYDLGDRLEAMAASPVLEVGVLQEYFTLAESNWNADRTRLELVLLPRQEQMAESLEEVIVEVSSGPEPGETEAGDSPRTAADGDAPGAGALRKLEMTDVDGETTVLTFRQVGLNPQLDPESLRLEVPEGTTVVRPTEGAE